MSITSIVSDAVGAVTGSGSTTDLKTFLSKFSDSSGKALNQLNPLNTFEVSMKFYPTLDNVSSNGWLSKLGNSLKNSAIGAAKNLVNNATGGLLGSLLNDSNGVMAEHDKFADAGKYSFMHYLAAANLLVGDENTWFGAAGQAPKPLELQLGYYVQSITVPQLKLVDGGKSTTLVGEFPLNGNYVVPDNTTFQLEILTTKLPLIERIFYPWMREVTLPYWSYETQPYTTATVTVDFSKHTDMKYVFYGCRPSQIALMQPNQENDQNSFKRQVTFLFDTMTIQSNLTTMESIGNKLLSTAGTLLNGAANMINL